MPPTAPTQRVTPAELRARLAALPPGTVSDWGHLCFQAEYGIDSPTGPALPSPEHQALIDACRYDVKRFAEEFFGHLFDAPFSAMHEDFFTTYAAQQNTRGRREATAAPRGSAKTTIRGFIKPVHDCVYKHERYILVVSSRSELAKDKVQEIRDELEQNTKLTAVYGSQVGSLWNQGDFITAQGVRVRAASPRSQVRGLLWRGLRPSKIILDDAENSEHVQTGQQRAKFYQWYMRDIAKLGAPGTNFDVIGTILDAESLLAELLQNPGYTPHMYRSVIHFNAAYDLWTEWRRIFIDLTNPAHQEDARAFFDAHHGAMLDGAEVLWPERESYYDLMVMRVVEGEDAFFAEKQNDPTKSSSYPFDMETAGYCRPEPHQIIRRDDRLVAYSELVRLLAFWDPALGEEAGRPDFSCCVILAQDRFGYYYALDAYLTQDDGPDKQIEAITELLWRWRVPEVGVERNGFQLLLVSNLREAVTQRRLQEEDLEWNVVFRPVTNVRAKHRRILALQPLIANQWLWFADHLPGEFYRQFARFVPTPNAGHDDAPDATESGIRLMKGLVDRRSSGG